MVFMERGLKTKICFAQKHDALPAGVLFDILDRCPSMTMGHDLRLAGILD